MIVHTMPPATPPMIPETEFTPGEWRALADLRRRHGQTRDLFSDGELAHLCFLNWLYHTGRLSEHGCTQDNAPAPAGHGA